LGKKETEKNQQANKQKAKTQTNKVPLNTATLASLIRRCHS